MSSVNWNTWKILKDRLCSGGLIESPFYSLQNAKKACDNLSSHKKCGCISDESFAGGEFTTNKGVGSRPVPGAISYVRRDRTKGIHSNILILKLYKSNDSSGNKNAPYLHYYHQENGSK